jgi:hypothetical protein
MPKTITLAQHNQKLVKELTTYGFQVVDSTTHAKPGHAADAYLYASYRPDTNDGVAAYYDHADISIGNYHYTTADHPAPIMLNITGLSTGQIADTLRHELARRPQL